MTRQIEIPQKPLQRFIELYEAFNEERGWWSDASPLRFSSVIAVTCPGDVNEIAEVIRSTASEMGDRMRWFKAISPSLRMIIGAMLVLHGDTPDGFLDEHERVQKMFRAVNLRRGGIYEMMAILVLRLSNHLQPITPETIDRFQDLYEQMKRFHWWLIGPDDFPACAALVGQDASAEQIGEEIEAIYQALSARGMSKGDPLQTAANLLYLAHRNPELVADQYAALADGFRAADVSVWQSDYDELAILSFLDHTPQHIVDSVLSYRSEMEQLRPKPDRSMTFNLASSIAFLDLVKLDHNLKQITDAKALMDMQAIIAAQQAAAAAAASSAAVAASSASSH
jgi:hypothetical protein